MAIRKKTRKSTSGRSRRNSSGGATIIEPGVRMTFADGRQIFLSKDDYEAIRETAGILCDSELMEAVRAFERTGGGQKPLSVQELKRSLGL